MPTIVHWRSSLRVYLVTLMSHLDTRRKSLSKHSFLRKRQACPEQRVLQDSFDPLIPHHQSTAESIRPDYAKSGKASLSNKNAFLEYSQKGGKPAYRIGAKSQRMCRGLYVMQKHATGCYFKWYIENYAATSWEKVRVKITILSRRHYVLVSLLSVSGGFVQLTGSALSAILMTRKWCQECQRVKNNEVGNVVWCQMLARELSHVARETYFQSENVLLRSRGPIWQMVHVIPLEVTIFSEEQIDSIDRESIDNIIFYRELSVRKPLT